MRVVPLPVLLSCAGIANACLLMRPERIATAYNVHYKHLLLTRVGVPPTRPLSEENSLEST